MPHIHDKYDFVISAFIVHDNKVLLVEHPRYGKWIPVGGHVELDEDPDMALAREIKEETGLEVELISNRPDFISHDSKILLRPEFIDVHRANETHTHIALVYFARALDNQHVLSEEHTDMQWLSDVDLDDPKYELSESVKYYCREALKKANTASYT